jgi:predicted glycosyltransferase
MVKKNQPRLLYYCLSLVGIGHLTASLQIINELLIDADVDLIYSGIDYKIFPHHNGFRSIQLPPLLFNDAGDLSSPDASASIDEVWHQRSLQIHDFLDSSYHGIVIEFCPFGRRKFKREIRALIKHIKNQFLCLAKSAKFWYLGTQTMIKKSWVSLIVKSTPF